MHAAVRVGIGGGLVLAMGCQTEGPARESAGDDEATGVLVTTNDVASTGGGEGDTSGFSDDSETDLSPNTSGQLPSPESMTAGCSEVEVAVEQTIPTLILLVDQSSSMTANFQGVSRWEAMYDTLVDPDDGVVPKLEDQVRFGFTLYSSRNGDEGGECPMLTSVEPMLGNYAAIQEAFEDADPIDETPTGESLAATAEMLAALDLDGPKGIVLATDGEPDTCAQPNPQNGQQDSLAAAQAAWDLGIQTFVISVGNEVGAQHLQEMANVGAGKAPDDTDVEPYYQALDPDMLVDAFEEIVGGFVSCTFEIDGLVDLEEACQGTVELDGQVLTCETDWRVPEPSTLELLGDACESLRSGGTHAVSATWPCGTVRPIP